MMCTKSERISECNLNERLYVTHGRCDRSDARADCRSDVRSDLIKFGVKKNTTGYSGSPVPLFHFTGEPLYPVVFFYLFDKIISLNTQEKLY